MKGIKAKVIGQQRVVPDYEKKRWETLKKNAEFMKSKGHGTLANKILQERAETWSKYAEDEDEYSRENDDYAQRTPIILNCYGQAIAPTPKDVKDLSSFLGTIARTTEFAPLKYVDWPSVPTHDQILEYVLIEVGLLETVNLSWRGYKSKLKKMCLEAVEKGSNLDELYELVPEDELKDLISYWNTSPAKEQSKKNKRNREKLDDMHTMGPSSYAALRHKLVINSTTYNSQTLMYK
ncbi:Threonine--tRNA ligase [Bienertia sinuspersici]